MNAEKVGKKETGSKRVMENTDQFLLLQALKGDVNRRTSSMIYISQRRYIYLKRCNKMKARLQKGDDWV